MHEVAQGVVKDSPELSKSVIKGLLVQGRDRPEAATSSLRQSHNRSARDKSRL